MEKIYKVLEEDKKLCELIQNLGFTKEMVPNIITDKKYNNVDIANLKSKNPDIKFCFIGDEIYLYKNKIVMFDEIYDNDRLRGIDGIYYERQGKCTLHGSGTYRGIDLIMSEDVNEITIEDREIGMYAFLTIAKTGSLIELTAKTSYGKNNVDVQFEYYDDMVQFYNSNVIEFSLGQGIFKDEEYIQAIENLITEDKTGYMKAIIKYIKEYNPEIRAIYNNMESKNVPKSLIKIKK